MEISALLRIMDIVDELENDEANCVDSVGVLPEGVQTRISARVLIAALGCEVILTFLDILWRA